MRPTCGLRNANVRLFGTGFPLLRLWRTEHFELRFGSSLRAVVAYEAPKISVVNEAIMDLSDRSDEDLLSGAATLVGSHRKITAKLVAFLGEIEERRLHLVAGFSSMFDFCQKKLGLSEGEAFRRILAARLGRRFPVVHALLAAGVVNLSTLELLA